jgi:hypothetical protein
MKLRGFHGGESPGFVGQGKNLGFSFTWNGKPLEGKENVIVLERQNQT